MAQRVEIGFRPCDQLTFHYFLLMETSGYAVTRPERGSTLPRSRIPARVKNEPVCGRHFLLDFRLLVIQSPAIPGLQRSAMV